MGRQARLAVLGDQGLCLSSQGSCPRGRGTIVSATPTPALPHRRPLLRATFSAASRRDGIVLAPR